MKMERMVIMHEGRTSPAILLISSLVINCYTHLLKKRKRKEKKRNYKLVCLLGSEFNSPWMLACVLENIRFSMFIEIVEGEHNGQSSYEGKQCY